MTTFSQPPELAINELPQNAYVYDARAGKGTTIYVMDSGLDISQDIGWWIRNVTGDPVVLRVTYGGSIVLDGCVAVRGGGGRGVE